jgi:hypothetical protein
MLVVFWKNSWDVSMIESVSGMPMSYKVEGDFLGR